MAKYVPKGRQSRHDYNVEPMQPLDVTPLWHGIPDESRDSVSAQDRSKAFLIRNSPMYAVGILTALCVTILYTLFGIMLETVAPYMLDRVLIFLVSLAGFLYYAHDRADKRDYDHSRAGVERLRLTIGGEVAKSHVQAERDLKIESMRMIAKRGEED